MERENSDFKWDSYEKVSLSQFEQLYEEGNQITLNLPEKHKLQQLHHQVHSYLQQSQHQLSIGLDLTALNTYTQPQ
jgi:hypothetical protein